MAIATAGAGLLLGAAPASAHSPWVNPTCEELQVSFGAYLGPDGNNQVTVTIDGQSRTFTFAESFYEAFTWSQTEHHTWSVVLDANRIEGDPTSDDWSRSGTQSACTPPETTTTVPETTTTVPETTTTVPETTTTAPETSTTAPETSTTTPPTTLPVSTTAAVVEVEPPLPQATMPPASVEPAPVPATLPVTGSSTMPSAVAGALLLGAGTAALFIARRVRPQR